MVGVPGRSRGCVTCRKRKKGCDLKQPSCGQCEARGIICGGYEPDRIFINTAAPSSSMLLSTAPLGQRHHDPIKLRTAKLSQFDIILPHGLANSAFREKVLETFLSIYLPHYNHGIRGRMIPPNSFANALSRLYAREEALKLAVTALGAATLGKVHGEEAWARQGRQLYGRSLQELRRALLDPDRASSEALSLVPRMGATFEILFGADANPSTQAQSWHSHAQGELAIMIARGPHGFRNEIDHQIFVGGRVPVVVAAIRNRKASILNRSEWKTIPWEKYPKTPRDTVLDIIVSIPEILEDIDNLHPERTDTLEMTARAKALSKCKKRIAEMESWAKANEHVILCPDTEDPTKVMFHDVSTAFVTVLFWAAALYLYGALAVLSPHASEKPTDRQYRHSTSPTSTDAVFWARRIARTVPYFLNPACGIWGTIVVAFPMGVALLCLAHDGPEKHERYLKLVFETWNDPKLPSSIQDFLNSMRRDAAETLVPGRPKFGAEFWIH